MRHGRRQASRHDCNLSRQDWSVGTNARDAHSVARCFSNDGSPPLGAYCARTHLDESQIASENKYSVPPIAPIAIAVGPNPAHLPETIRRKKEHGPIMSTPSSQ